MDHQTQQDDMTHVKAEATTVASPTHDDDYSQDTPLSSQVDNQSQPNKPKRAGRRKINIEFIKDKSRRHITFSKRKAGIMKKAYELSTLTGTQVLLLVASETGHVYTFATPKLQPLITKTEGKNLIQACLNAPDMQGGGGDAQGMGPDDQMPPGIDYEGGLEEEDTKQKMKGNTMNMTAYAPPQQQLTQQPPMSSAQGGPQTMHQQPQYSSQQSQQYQYSQHHPSHSSHQQLPSMQNHSMSPHHFNQQQGMDAMPQQYQQSHYQNAGGYGQGYQGSNLPDGVTSIPNLRVIDNGTPQANYMTQFSQSNQYQ